MTIGEKIREARKQAGLTQEQLAEKLSVSRPAVAKWETDKGIPDVENLKALAALLNVSVDYLLDDGDAQHTQQIREPINLDDYENTGRYHSRQDAAVGAKYPSADAIYPLIRRKKLSRWENIIDFVVGAGAFHAADQLTDTSAWYLVEQGDMQFLVSVTGEFITSNRVPKRITEKKFTVGKNLFIRAEYTVPASK